jgi:hypothetical protein
MKTGLSLAATVAFVLGTTSPAAAQDRVAESVGPNRALLRAGVATLAVSYAPAVVVAATSDRKGDEYLYVPAAGPWLDLANRSECETRSQCDHESLYKALIITDGVVQGLGSLQILGALLFSDGDAVTTTTKAPRTNTGVATSPHIVIRPAAISRGYGVVARAEF